MNARNIEKIVIALVALHSFALGAAMLTAPVRTLSLVGWDYKGDPFFPCQSGIFLLLFSTIYIAAVQYRSYVWILVETKMVAVLFLVATYAVGTAPPIILLTASLDWLMGSAVFLIVWHNLRQEKRRKAVVAAAATDAPPFY